MTYARSEDLEIAVAAARRAGAAIRHRFGRSGDVHYKSPEQPVTEADFEADRIVREALTRHRPRYGWLSEESQPGAGSRDRPTWVVDPLDGTVNFVEGRPEFAVCVGLLERGTPVLGVVYNPMKDAVYTAVEGEPARLDDVVIRAIRPPGKDPTIVLSWNEAGDPRLAGLQPGWRRTTVGSTALKIMRVAEGAADAYVSLGRKEVWDLCAAAIIARCAGATLLDLSGEPIPLSHDFSGSDGLIVVGDLADRADIVDDLLRRLSGADVSRGKGAKQ